MLKIDGSTLEGGGGLLRTAVALAACVQKPIEVFNIRAKRKPPGLKAQHLNAVRAVAQLCDAKLEGAKLGSMRIKFFPSEVSTKRIRVHVETAGSTGLILTTLLPPILYSGKEVEVEVRGGGTYNKLAPPVDYIEHVLARVLNGFGANIEIEIERHGFYPKGGASVRMICKQSNLRSIELIERGNLLSINGISVASDHLKERRVAERQRNAALKALVEKECDKRIEIDYCKTLCPGSGITLWAEFERAVLGGDDFGQRGKSSEEVGRNAASKLLEELNSDAAVDLHLTDLLIPYIALFGGKMRIREMSMHARTAAWVCEQVVGKSFEVKGSILCLKQ